MSIAPLVSIVVPTFHSAATLAAALESLAQQTERDFELVISDGSSTDATLRICQQWAGAMPRCVLLSRPDRGVYDAINLGIAAASGQWVLVLGSDDRLHAPDTLARAATTLRNCVADLVHGDVRVMANRMGTTAGGRLGGPMTLHTLMRGNICQQAIFYRRALFARLGGFELSYPVLADWHFNLRAAFTVPMQWIDLVVADYAATGISANRADPAGEIGVAEWLRQELLRRRNEPATWPHQRVLLRQADTLRRKGHWRLALQQIGSFLALRTMRLASRRG